MEILYPPMTKAERNQKRNSKKALSKKISMMNKKSHEKKTRNRHFAEINDAKRCIIRDGKNIVLGEEQYKSLPVQKMLKDGSFVQHMGTIVRIGARAVELKPAERERKASGLEKV